MELFLDFTTAHIITVAMAKKGGILGYVSYGVGEGYASRYIVDAVSRCEEFSGVGIKDVKKIVVSRGPGSFTALRALLAYVKGVAFSLKIPVETYLSFDWIALLMKEKMETWNDKKTRQSEEKKVIRLSMFSGAKDIFYFAEYSYDLTLKELSLKKKDELKKVIMCEEEVDFELGAKMLFKLSSLKKGKVFDYTELDALSPEYVFRTEFKKSKMLFSVG